MDTVRLLVVDDSAVFREGLLALLATIADVEVVGQASSGEQGVEQAVALQPDVVLMDLSMPGAGGVEATRTLVSASPHIAVLVLTMDDHNDSVVAAMRAGARGYLLKGTRQEGLLHAIHTVRDGGAVFGPAIARRLIALLTPDSAAPTDPSFGNLTPRERQILEHIARGHSNAQIAEQLGLSRKTVRNHVSSVFAKLQVGDRPTAIIKAREAGLGSA